MRTQVDSPRPSDRPLLRGWSHALAVPLAGIFTVALAERCVGDGARLFSMLVYGLSLMVMYGWSAAYHIVTWSPRHRRLMRQVDHANIFVVIAATSTAIGSNVLDGSQRVILLASVWLLALVGLAMNLLRIHLSPGPRVALYLATGLTGLVAIPGILDVLPPLAIAIGVLGGILYALGGLVYSVRRPDPLPRIFGYHEVFHVLVLAGGLAYAVVIWVWVVP